MYTLLTNGARKALASALGATLLTATTLAMAAGPDDVMSGWLGKEITIGSSSFSDHIPVGGKLTLVFDSEDNVVRVCTRAGAKQRTPWRMDFAVPCNVVLTFTRGERYCSVDDVKTGNAEVLSACHRLRSHDVAMHPAATKGSLELHDMIVFLVQGENGKHVVSILVDSPSRVTAGGIAIGTD